MLEVAGEREDASRCHGPGCYDVGDVDLLP